MVYEWKTKGLYKVSPDIAGNEIERCRDEDGIITPGAVVAQASNEDNPLHSCFEWDDMKAAAKWREQEARVLICNLATVMEIAEPDASAVTVRAFVNVVGNDSSERGYKNIVSVLMNKKEREYMLDKAMGELRSFQVKYGVLSELAEVFAAIKKVGGDA